MLRLVPTLIGNDEEPRAAVVGANGMPGAARPLLVATDRRILWAEGRRLFRRHGVRLGDVDRFEIDHGAGAVTLVDDGQVLSISPIAKRDLTEYERLLRGASGGDGTSVSR
jgi:hypothetical protein